MPMSPPVTPVRPPILPNPAPTGAATRPDAGRTAAQKAFFDLAMGKAAPPQAAAIPASAPTPAPQRTVAASGEAPARIMRPGSLLDIRI